MIRAKRAGELFYIDVVGPISLIGYNGIRFIVYDIDDAFRVHFGDCIKEKREAPRAFRVWVVYFENCIKYNIQYIHLDNDKEYVKLGVWAFEKDILIEPTVFYLSEMNELVEVSGKMIIGKARSILIDAGLLKELWLEVVSIAIYFFNRLPM